MAGERDGRVYHGPEGGTGPLANWLSNVLLKSLKSLLHSPPLGAPRTETSEPNGARYTTHFSELGNHD
ncbi:unnamed protein product [Sphenostylis stenocarpa]|uniref:Uncharacterized protein n=1 Tax=Sphenostylis stenocarpa TaxID=92480 RepID=A0AA86RYS0_9FABA|nr:unnamed protein product [Sphenostylis stenocarpa]